MKIAEIQRDAGARCKKRTCGVLSLLMFYVGVFFFFLTGPAYGVDSEFTRKSLAGIQAATVVIEEFQPNMQKYDKYLSKAGAGKAELQREIENRMRAAGIRVVSGNDWLRTKGRPVLYININTHETEMYWFAFDIRVELQQIASLEINPSFKTMANTWSLNMTGTVNIGNLQILRENTMVLVERFIQAYKAANGRR